MEYLFVDYAFFTIIGILIGTILFYFFNKHSDISYDMSIIKGDLANLQIKVDNMSHKSS